MFNYVTSSDNKIIKEIRKLNKRAGREKLGEYYAEGLRLVNDALLYSKDCIKYFVLSKSFSESGLEFSKKIDRTGKSVYIAEDKIFNSISDTVTPQGILAVMEIPENEVIDFNMCQYILILDQIAEPGNMGTIIRTAEAAGIDGICLINNCTDVYAPKVIRASMGSAFRMKIQSVDEAFVSELKNSGFTVLATALKDSEPIESIKLNGKRALIIGNEAHGVSESLIKLADKSVRIEMCGRIESLNAAVAAGIAMYILKV